NQLKTTRNLDSRHIDDDFDRKLEILCEVAVKLSGIDHSAITLFDSNLKLATVRAEFPIQGSAAGRIISLEEIASERDLSDEATPLIVKDVEYDERLGHAKSLVTTLGIKSLV